MPLPARRDRGRLSPKTHVRRGGVTLARCSACPAVRDCRAAFFFCPRVDLRDRGDAGGLLRISGASCDDGETGTIAVGAGAGAVAAGGADAGGGLDSVSESPPG